MIEMQLLIKTIFILYYSLIGVTIIALTSIIALFVVSPFSIIIRYRLSEFVKYNFKKCSKC